MFESMTIQWEGLLKIVKAAACAPMTLGGAAAVLVEPDRSGMLCISPTSEEGRHISQIARWTETYKLTLDEVYRLKAVLVDYPPAECDGELVEELRCIMAARKLSTMPELTAEEVDRAKFAFETGLMPFIRQQVD
jgi:hypothetical protein